MQNLSLWSSGMCRKQNFEDTFFAFSFLPHIMFSFAGHLAGFILVWKVFGKLGGSLRVRWKERVWVVKQDFHATFQDNVTFFCFCLFFCLFLQMPWLNRAHYQQPSHNFGFQSSVQKNKHPGREDTGLWPTDNVLMTCFIRFSLAKICFVPHPLTPFYGDVNLSHRKIVT